MADYLGSPPESWDDPLSPYLQDIYDECVSTGLFDSNSPIITEVPEGSGEFYTETGEANHARIFKQKLLVYNIGYSTLASLDPEDIKVERGFIWYANMEDLPGVVTDEERAQLLASYDLLDLDDSSGTPEILARAYEINPDLKACSYVHLGIDPYTAGDELTLSEIYALVDVALSHGFNGMFLDEFGYDYGVTRARQNAVIDYCHAQGLFVVVNAWHVDDTFSPTYNPTYNGIEANPDSLYSTLNSSDYYMFESAFMSGTDYSTTARVYEIYQYDKEVDATLGTTYREYYGTKTLHLSQISSSQDYFYNKIRDMVWGSYVLNADCIMVSDENYHSHVNLPTPMPDDLSLIRSYMIEAEEYIGSYPTRYTATKNGIEISLNWYPPDNIYVTYNGEKVYLPIASNIHGMQRRITGETVYVVDTPTHTVTSEDLFLQVERTGTSEVTITIPTALLEDSAGFYIKDAGMNASVNNITILTEGSELIDNASGRIINIDGGSVYLVPAGGHWWSMYGLAGTTLGEDSTDTTVKSWILSGAYNLSSITYDSDGDISTASLVYPDGSTGSISNVIKDSRGILSLQYSRGVLTYNYQISYDLDGNVSGTTFV